jgi:ABC-2 type transport system ATP-binding protein
MTSPIIATGLARYFGSKDEPIKAVDGVDLEVKEGEIFGFLGPNGAGKSTTVRMLTTLLRPSAGQAFVAGYDIVKDADKVRRSIGVALQDAAIDPLMTGNELLELQAVLYGIPANQMKKRADELLERVGLTAAADRRVGTYSGGMRRRLDLAASLVGRPQVMFLDEPTTGIDPRSRMDVWELVEDLVRGGTTVLLTTQYLEEADQLARDVLVIDHGRAIAKGTPDELKAMVGGERIEVVVTDRTRLGDAAAVLARHAIDEVRSDPQTGLVSVGVRGGSATLSAVIDGLTQASVPVGEVGLRRATLDEVFLTLTGAPAEVDA